MTDEMIPDQIMKALEFAEHVLDGKKEHHLGSTRSVVQPMKFLLFHDPDFITDNALSLACPSANPVPARPTVQ
jgi:hypothetical protein